MAGAGSIRLLEAAKSRHEAADFVRVSVIGFAVECKEVALLDPRLESDSPAVAAQTTAPGRLGATTQAAGSPKRSKAFISSPLLITTAGWSP